MINSFEFWILNFELLYGSNLKLRTQNSKLKTQIVMFLEQVIEDYLENYADTPTEEVIFYNSS